MNEFELITKLTAGQPLPPSVVAGPGDDCAVLEMGLAGKELLFKTDAVVEGIHFLPGTPGRQIGHKALARCLSDVAAMAGTPRHALVTLGLPSNYQPEVIQEIYAGMHELGDQWGVSIVGGEVTTNPERLLISIALLGEVKAGQAIRRKGAAPGDAIFVTGELGGSLAGKHLEFTPRLQEAQWLASHFAIHAMIDLSDGLAGDLRHILEESQVGAELLAKNIPISKAAKIRARAEKNAPVPLAAALSDGEDFELLFTLASAKAVPLADAWRKQFPKLKLSCIGRITAGHGLKLLDRAQWRDLTEHGYTHFA